MNGKLTQLNVSNGGMPKLPIETARVTANGVAGDRQTDKNFHGGPDRAVCLFSEELYAWLKSEYGIDISYGSVGENFTTRGIDYDSIEPGDRLRVGEVCTIEITDVRAPCGKLRKWHPELKEIVMGNSGWLARVIVEGDVKPGDAIEVIKNRG